MFEKIILPVLVVFACLIFVYGIYLFLIAPGFKSKEKKQKMNKLLQFNYAHRGLHNLESLVPENSIKAFSLAKAAGYGIELDLNLTKDGKVVVFHDNDLLRACGVDFKIEELTWDEISKFKVFGTEEKIPLFADVLEEIDGGIPLLVELKNSKRYKELCEKSSTLLDGYKGDYCIESFNPQIVYWFKKNRPYVVRGQLSSSVKGLGEENSIIVRFLLSALFFNFLSRPDFAAYQYSHAKRKLGIKSYRLLGGKLFGWTIADEKSAKEYLALFDSIIFENFSPEKV